MSRIITSAVVILAVIAGTAVQGSKPPVPNGQPGMAGVMGHIVAVDMERRAVTVATVEQVRMTLEITPATRIMIGESEGRLADLQVGQDVIGEFAAKDGKQVCTELKVFPK